MPNVKVWSKERGLRTLKDGVTLDEYRLKVAPSARVVKVPGIRSLERMSFDGIAKAIDGCKVEPDGCCQHGFPSWLMVVGVI